MAFPPYTILQQQVGGNVKKHYLDGDGDVDGARKIYDATILNDGFTANPVVSLWDTQGGKVREQVLDMNQVEAGAKADSVTAFQSGADLHLTIRYHVGDYNSKDIHTVLTGWLTPYPAGMTPKGKAGAFVPGQNTGGSGVTLDELTAALNDGNSDYHHALKNAVKDFVNQALAEAGVLTLALTRAGGDAGYYQQAVNMGYTASLGALRAAGLYHGQAAAKATASDVVNAAQAVPANLAEKGKQVQAEEEWNKYPKGQAIGTEGEQPKKEGEK